MEKAETMQKIKDINKLENRDKDISLYEHSENIKNNQEKGINSSFSPSSSLCCQSSTVDAVIDRLYILAAYK